MSENKSDIIDLGAILRGYLSKWYYFVISVIVCVVIGFLFILRILPQYEVNARIRLDGEQGFSSMISGGLSGVTDLIGGGNANGEDEIEIMMSHTVLSDVVRRLGLEKTHLKRLRPTVYKLMYRDYPVDVIVGDDIQLDTLRTQLMFRVKVNKSGKANVALQGAGRELFSGSDLTFPAELKTDYGTFTVVTTDNFVPGVDFTNKIMLNSYGQAAENLREFINVGLADKNSQIVELQMFSSNVKYGIDVINAIIDEYLITTRGHQEAENKAIARFLDERINSVRENLDRTEIEMTSLREKNGLSSQTALTSEIAERLSETEKTMIYYQVNYEMAQLTLQMVRESAKDNSLIPLQGDNEAIAQLILSYNNCIMRRMSIESSAKPDNVAMQRLDEQILSLRKNLISTLETSVTRAEELKKEYENRFDKIRAELESMPKAEYELYSIMRQRTIEEELFIFLLKKQEETAMLLSNVDSQATIIDRAYSPNEDFSTSKLMVLLIAFCFGLVIPPVWFYVSKFICPGSLKSEVKE
ncbi:MAG: hypothetical protein E7082_00975 [Bacteroidales bacterium]|nr:hypothetical protein [Bacteroidales bacterium]